MSPTDETEEPASFLAAPVGVEGCGEFSSAGRTVSSTPAAAAALTASVSGMKRPAPPGPGTRTQRLSTLRKSALDSTLTPMDSTLPASLSTGPGFSSFESFFFFPAPNHPLEKPPFFEAPPLFSPLFSLSASP